MIRSSSTWTRQAPRRHGERYARRSIGPALIYAYEETGLIVTEDNRRMIPDVDLREFDAKVREYYDLHPEDDPKAC